MDHPDVEGDLEAVEVGQRRVGWLAQNRDVASHGQEQKELLRRAITREPEERLGDGQFGAVLVVDGPADRRQVVGEPDVAADSGHAA